MSTHLWHSRRIQSLAGGLATLVMAQVVALGANGPLLAMIAATASIAFMLAALPLLQPDDRFWRGAWPALFGLAAMILWAALPGLVPSLAPGRPAPDLFRFGLARLLGGCALFAAAGFIGFRRGLLRLAVDWLVVLGLCQIAIGIWLRETNPSSIWGVDKTINAARYTGTMINSNANATVNGVTALLAFGRLQAFLRAPVATTVAEALLRAACALTVIIAFGVVVISGSRTVFSLMLVLMAVLALLDPMVRHHLRGRRSAILLGAIAIVVVVLFATTGHTALQRFGTLEADSIDRVALWRHYAALVRHTPPFGYGLGAFTELNQVTIRGPFQAVLIGYVHSAHNELLELVLEGGRTFAALALATLALIVWTIVRPGIRDRDDPLIRSIPAAILLVVSEAMVDIALDVPAVAALAIVLLGMMWGRAIRIAAVDAASGRVAAGRREAALSEA